MFKKILLILVGLNLLVILLVSVYGMTTYKRIVVKPNAKPSSKSILPPSPTPTPDPDRPFSILLMGYGGGKHDGGRLTDSIMIARIDPKSKKTLLISIPRDLWVQLPISESETKGYKVNAAYAIGADDKRYPNKSIEYTGPAGGGQMSKKVLSDIVGLPIDYFIALDFQGFTKTIDSLGGVDVNVDRSFEDKLYPIEKDEIDNCGKSEEEIKALTATMSGTKLEEQFPCRYETLKFEKGLVHMDGQTSLKYVRSRHAPEDGGDYNRSRRQRILLDAVKKKVFSINFVPKIVPFINTLSYHLTTDIDLDTAQKLISRIEEFKDYPVASLAFTEDNALKSAKSKDGQYILVDKAGEGDWSTIKSLVSESISQN